MKIYKIAVPIPLEEDWEKREKEMGMAPVSYKELDNIIPKEGVEEIEDRYPNAKIIDGGHFGLVYDIGDNKILKITYDSSEFVLASELMEMNSSVFVDIYDVDQKYGNRSRYWTIVAEKIEPLNSNQKKIVGDIIAKYRVFMPLMLRRGREEKEVWFEFVNALKQHGYFDKIQNKNFFNLFSSFVQNLNDEGISLYESDIHNNNIGFNKNGRLVILDLGGIEKH